MTTDDLLHAISRLKDTDVRTIVIDRIASFRANQDQTDDAVFQELCFCLLTAHCSADHCLAIQHALGPLFLSGTREDIEHELRAHHYRFPPRAAHIVTARHYKDGLTARLRTLPRDERRRWLADTIPGLGLKEASHFLRNTGYDDYAIIDTHILDLLTSYHIIQRPRSLTPTRYLDIETTLQKIADQAGLTLAELDLYLWYLQTKKIVK